MNRSSVRFRWAAPFKPLIGRGLQKRKKRPVDFRNRQRLWRLRTLTRTLTLIQKRGRPTSLDTIGPRSTISSTSLTVSRSGRPRKPQITRWPLGGDSKTLSCSGVPICSTAGGCRLRLETFVEPVKQQAGSSNSDPRSDPNHYRC